MYCCGWSAFQYRSSFCCICSTSSSFASRRLRTRKPPHARHLISPVLDTLARRERTARPPPPCETHWRAGSPAARHDADMAVPEHEIAAAELVLGRQSMARPSSAACMSASRGAAWPAASTRELHQARAIQPDAGAPAPEIGRAEKASATATKSACGIVQPAPHGRRRHSRRRQGRGTCPRLAATATSAFRLSSASGGVLASGLGIDIGAQAPRCGASAATTSAVSPSLGM